MSNTSEQVDYLLGLGQRLNNWCTPGDAEDYLTPKDKSVPLWNELALKRMKQPALVCDLLMARWMVVKDYQKQEPVALIPNPAQRHFSENRSGKDIVLKAGRAGFTTQELCRSLLYVATHEGYTGLLVTYDSPAALLYFIQARFSFERMAGNLGKELRLGALKTEKKNVRELYFPSLNSHLYVESAGAFAPAEGDSIQYLMCDEFARWLKGDPNQTIATLLSHVTGDDTQVIMMSRPFGQSGEFYERYWRARRGESTYKAHFYQWWWNPGQRMRDVEAFKPNAEEEKISEKYKQWFAEEAPKDSALPEELPKGKLMWRRAQKSELGDDKFGQEFAEDEAACFLGSGNCPFDGIAIDKVLKDVTPVLERLGGKGESENGLLRWRDYDPDHWYLLFIDPAGTHGTSRIAMFLLDGVTGEQCVEWVGRCSAGTAAEIAMNNIVRKFPRTIVAVELNLGAISATMVATFCGEPYKLVTDPARWPRLYREQVHGDWRAGWETNPNNRPKMLNDFGDVWKDHPDWFHSARLANEVRSSVRNGDRIEEGKGMTNDLVMAAAGAHAIRPLIRVKAKEPTATILRIKKIILRDDRGWEAQD